MLTVHESITPFIDSQLPQFYGLEGSLLTAFLEAYYEWMSETYSRQILANRDIDLAVDSFLINFKNTYLPSINFDAVTNKRRLVKNAIDIYRSKGTSRGIDLFMKLVYGVEANVYFPSEDVFRPSDARWTTPRFIELTSSSRTSDLVGKTITGVTSQATAFAQSHVRRRTAGDNIDVLNLTNIEGTFVIGEQIYNTTIYNDSPAIVGSPLTGTITDGGANFEKYQDLAFRNNRGDNGIARVTGIDSGGAITKVKIIESGVGFRDGATVSLYYGSVKGATMTVTLYPVGRGVGYSVGSVLGETFLHDNDYYQEYSYDVLSSIPFDKYSGAMKAILHPAGKRMFGSILINSEVDLSETISETAISSVTA